MSKDGEKIEHLAKIIIVHADDNRMRVQLAAIKILCITGHHAACSPRHCETRAIHDQIDDQIARELDTIEIGEGVHHLSIDFRDWKCTRHLVVDCAECRLGYLRRMRTL